MASFQWRHCFYVTEKPYQTNVTRFFRFGPILIIISGYASGANSSFFGTIDDGFNKIKIASNLKLKTLAIYS